MQCLKRYNVLCSLFLSFPLLGVNGGFIAQELPSEKADSTRWYSTILEDGDTLARVRKAEVVIDGQKEKKSAAYWRKYERLKPKVIKVYPYAEVAGLLLEHYEERLGDMEMEARRKLYMKKVEDQLKAEFKDDITDLTISEGRILMKLIDRETGTTSFKIIKDFRGKLAAYFWQGVAKVFGHDLRARYDPVDEDRVMEDIVLDIRSGKLEIPERAPKSEKVRKLLRAETDVSRWWKLKS